MMSAPAPLAFARPWITDEERKAVLEVLAGHVLTHGPQGRAFEAEFATFLGAGAHCVTVSSCMAALHLAYLTFGIGPDDEVIVPALTHAATAHAVEWVGARPVFVDCDARTGNVTADLIAAALTERTRAVSLVHFAGIPAAMDDIVRLTERAGVRLIEDCALAIGARFRGRHVGLFGDAGTFSFYPTKHIATGEGGMFVTRHRDVAERVAKLRAFGVDRSHTERALPGMYDVPTLGLNYRMSEVQAAMGRPQLSRMDENLARRRVNFQALRSALASVPGLRVVDAASREAESSHYCLSVVLTGPLAGRRRDAVVRQLNASGIETSIYYPQPVPRMTYYQTKYGYQPAAFPEVSVISDGSIALPVGPHLGEQDMNRIAATLTEILTRESAR